jgi:hypothetical protein
MKDTKKMNWLLFISSPVLALIDKVFVGKNKKSISTSILIFSVLVFIYAMLKINS